MVSTGPTGERRDDGVDARAVGEARVDHRRRLVDAPAEGRDDALDDAHHVLVVLEVTSVSSSLPARSK